MIQWDQIDSRTIKPTKDLTKSEADAEKDEEIALKMTLDDEL